MGDNLVAHRSVLFFLACTEVDAYMVIKYFLKMYDTLGKALINSS